ncbi:uncharacterized protein LOC116209419 [Punica granatum]|nr:uncharacterized protein LOC116209419 [Punica granatum]
MDIAEWLQMQEMMNQKGWSQSLHTIQNMNTHVQIAPPYQEIESMMSGYAGNPIFSDGLAEADFPNGGGTIEMGRAKAYNPILRTPAGFDFSISSHMQYQFKGLPLVNDFYHDFSQIAPQDWELSFQHENIIPDQLHENIIPGAVTILDTQGNLPFGDNAVKIKSEIFPGTSVHPMIPAHFGLRGLMMAQLPDQINQHSTSMYEYELGFNGFQ